MILIKAVFELIALAWIALYFITLNFGFLIGLLGIILLLTTSPTIIIYLMCGMGVYWLISVMSIIIRA